MKEQGHAAFKLPAGVQSLPCTCKSSTMNGGNVSTGTHGSLRVTPWQALRTPPSGILAFPIVPAMKGKVLQKSSRQTYIDTRWIFSKNELVSILNGGRCTDFLRQLLQTAACTSTENVTGTEK